MCGKQAGCTGKLYKSCEQQADKMYLTLQVDTQTLQKYPDSNAGKILT